MNTDEHRWVSTESNGLVGGAVWRLLRVRYLCTSVFIGGWLTILSPSAFAAAPRVQFSRQVLPVLNRECRACHTGSAAPGGFSMESAQRLLAGGRHGAAVVPGKSAESPLVKYLTGELKPQMPPGKPLAMDTIAVLRRWIDEGARIDSMTAPATRSAVQRSPPGSAAQKSPPQKVPTDASRLTAQAAPVTALAYSPDGKVLAVGGYQAVRLLDPATGRVARTLAGPADQVLALSWSSDGRWLAAAGGVPGVSGEICVWNTVTWVRPRVLKRHADTIYGLAWRPGASEFAAASLDKTVTIWNTASGTVIGTLKDHADGVFAVAYSPDGKWMATGSADRSVKLYQTKDEKRGDATEAKGKEGTGAPDPRPGAPSPARPVAESAPMRPVAAMSHPDAVTAIVFGPKSDMLVSACMDKKARVWPVRAASIENPLRSHDEGDAINTVAFSASGNLFVWGAANRKVRIWNDQVSEQKRELNDPADWVYTVAASPDGKTVAAGSGDGKVYFWNSDDGKLLRAERMGGGATQVAGAARTGKAGTAP